MYKDSRCVWNVGNYVKIKVYATSVPESEIRFLVVVSLLEKRANMAPVRDNQA